MVNYIYGPVPSRRLGRSLGIDIVPYKTCTLDCIYCQLGRTTRKVVRRKPCVSKDDVLRETRTYLKGDKQIDFVTIAGSGEPTLNSDIGELIKDMKKMVQVPVAILTNGTLLYMEDVRQALLEADVVLPSLDAASPEMFERMNRPHRALKIDSIVDGLKKFREVYKGEIWLEIMLVKGFNTRGDELSKIRKAVSQIMPDKVYLNTVTRPPSETYAEPLSIAEMNGIRKFFGKKCEIIGKFHSEARQETENVRQYILETTKRRPLTSIDIANIFGISETNAAMMIERLEAEGVVRERRQGTKKYYIFRKIKDRITIH